jgi:hypothetical protein
MSGEAFQFFAMCDICGARVQAGRHIYDGKRAPMYDLFACNLCRAEHKDGWGPDAEPKILAHLKAKGLPVPTRNERGRLPLE